MNRADLIDAVTLAKLSDDGGVLIVDCRFDIADPERAERGYALAHIAGARYAHLDRDLSNLDRDLSNLERRNLLGRHPLPDAAAFSQTLSRWGWSPNLRVVAYDAAGGALAAARLWWMLKLAGHHNTAVLDGGLPAWIGAGLALVDAAPNIAPAPAPASAAAAATFDPAQIVYSDALADLRTNPRTLLIDARAAARYRGEVEPIDPVAGHVPGAANRPFSENLDASGRFKAPQVLRAEFLTLLGGRDPGDVIHMCGSGVTACHNLLAMEHAGLRGSRVYAPSWSGWISDPARPIEQGG